MIRENLYIIAAITDETRAIGCNNKLLLHLSKDLQYFKEKTLGHNILMGRKTYESLQFRPLPQRKNIVLSSRTIKEDKVTTFHNVESVLKYVDETDEKVYICGGAKVYEEFLPYARYLYLTLIDESTIDRQINADTFFPKFNEDDYRIISSKDEVENGIKYKFVIYKKKD